MLYERQARVCEAGVDLGIITSEAGGQVEVVYPSTTASSQGQGGGGLQCPLIAHQGVNAAWGLIRKGIRSSHPGVYKYLAAARDERACASACERESACKAFAFHTLTFDARWAGQCYLLYTRMYAWVREVGVVSGAKGCPFQVHAPVKTVGCTDTFKDVLPTKVSAQAWPLSCPFTCGWDDTGVSGLGTGNYYNLGSRVCLAAVHAGVIRRGEGGRMLVDVVVAPSSSFSPLPRSKHQSAPKAEIVSRHGVELKVETDKGFHFAQVRRYAHAEG